MITSFVYFRYIIISYFYIVNTFVSFFNFLLLFFHSCLILDVQGGAIMNERVKELRKALGLSGEKFGENIGLNRAAISKIENNAVGVSESNVKLICLTYNVNEDWLRTGQGSMFNETKNEFLEELKRLHNLSDFQVELVKTYLELPDKDKDSIDKFIASCAKHPYDKEI